MGALRIGYARVSTQEQSLDLQVQALKAGGCARLYEEHASGAGERPELRHALSSLRSGDTLVVWRLDRIGRSMPDLVQLMDRLRQEGIGFHSLTESIDTTSASGALIAHVFAAFAQFERDLIRERTRAGLAAARAQGRKPGRPRRLNDRQLREVETLAENPAISITDIALRYRVSRATLYNHLAALRRRKETEEG